MKRYIYLCLFAILACTGLFLLKLGLLNSIKKVDVYRVGRGTIDIFVQSSGKIEAAKQKEVYAEKTSYVNKLNVKLGQNVDEGDVLADITVKEGAVISEEDLAKIESLEDIKNIPDISAFTNKIKSENIQKVTEGTVISSLKGMITELNIKEESYASTSKPLFVISDLSTLLVKCQISERQISNIEKGQKAEITGTAFKNSKYTAEVISIAPVAKDSIVNTSVQTAVEVVLKIENPDSILKPGYTADVKIIATQKSDIIKVPFETIMQDNDNNEFVYVYKNGYITKRIVKCGLEGLNDVEVAGLNENDIIVYKPDDTLKSGQRVRVRSLKQC